MHDPWTERLSEYLDGELPAADTIRLESHLESCDVCATTLAELREVVGRARTLESSGPARDLWGGIAAAIAQPGAGADHVQGDRDVLPLRSHPHGAPEQAILPHPRDTRLASRRFSLSLPQLAAAAMLLLAAGAGAAWMAGLQLRSGQPGATAAVASAPQDAGPILFAAYGDDTAAPSADAPDTRRFDADVAALHESLDEVRDQLDPATVDVVERSLESIDNAIRTAREALSADPGNPYLQRQLDGAMQKKLDVLRRASRVRRGAT